MDESIGIAGAGRVARALGRLLVDAGEPVVAVASRDVEHLREAAAFMGPSVRAVAYAEVPRSVGRWVIAVPDRALTEVARMLAESSDARVALHTCGARGADALAPLQAHGVDCGTLHPLQTVTWGMEGVAALRGIAYAVGGDAAAVEWASRIAALAQGEALRIEDEFRPLYHAAAVMSSNYVMALMDASQTLLKQCGIDAGTALRAIGPLIRTAVENGLARGPVEALTGPIERGDVETVAAHLAALRCAATPAPGLVCISELYRSAGLATVQLARRRGLDAGRAEELELTLRG